MKKAAPDLAIWKAALLNKTGCRVRHTSFLLNGVCVISSDSPTEWSWIIMLSDTSINVLPMENQETRVPDSQCVSSAHMQNLLFCQTISQGWEGRYE